MERRRFKQALTLNERLQIEAARLRLLATSAKNSVERDLLLDRAHQYDTAKHMDGYLQNHDLQAPK